MATAAQLKKLRKKYGLGEFKSGKGKSVRRRRKTRTRFPYTVDPTTGVFTSGPFAGQPAPVGATGSTPGPVGGYSYNRPAGSKGAGGLASASLQASRDQLRHELMLDQQEGVQQ